jgi:hypothetical protein
MIVRLFVVAATDSIVVVVIGGGGYTSQYSIFIGLAKQGASRAYRATRQAPRTATLVAGCNTPFNEMIAQFADR